MTQPPLNEQQLAELAEMLALAKTTEKKARELNELTLAFEEKWQHRLESRQGTQQQASQRRNKSE